MRRSSSAERARRINAALVLVRKHGSLAKAASQLAAQCAISRRQAYRYVREARATGRPVAIPEPKVTFSVKLSQDLILALRQRATSTGKTISELVAQAVEAFLAKGCRRG